MHKTFIIIPAYCEASVIQNVIREIKEEGYKNIIIIDDGSQDDTYKKASAVDGVIVLKHFLNRGKGAAIKTGIEAAKILEADFVISMDGDGQHNPGDIQKMISLLNDSYDVVLGTRLKNPKGMPIHKIIANYVGNLCTWVIYGLWVTDSQSGFRAYSRRTIDLIETKTDRYEYDSEVIREISRHKLRYVEIPIEVRYTKYSMSKQYRMNLQKSLKTLIKMALS